MICIISLWLCARVFQKIKLQLILVVSCQSALDPEKYVKAYFCVCVCVCVLICPSKHIRAVKLAEKLNSNVVLKYQYLNGIISVKGVMYTFTTSLN